MKFEIYRFIPKKEIKNAAVLTGVFILATAALWIIQVFINNPNLKMIYQLSGVVTATIAAQITTRFIISGYIYILNETDFIIFKASSKKSVQVCNISLETAIDVIDISGKNKKFADIKKQFGKIDIRLNFCQNLFPGKSYSYIFDYGDKKALIKFEGDEYFIAEMKRRIDYAKLGDWE